MPAGDLTIEGGYSTLEYRLTFLLDGAVFSETTLTFGAPVFAPEAPVREGYTFSGWGELPELMPAEELTLEGGYTANLYRLAFLVDGAVVFEESLPYGASVTVPAVEEKPGFAFSGFGEIPAAMPAEDLTLEGGYTANLYRLAFLVDGAVVFEENLPYGASVTVPAVEEKPGFAFSGFGEIPAAMPAEDLTLEGQYTQLLYKLTATVDGEVISEQTLAAGESYLLAEPEAREGYTFAWDAASGIMPAADLTVSGAYTALLYTLTFTYDGETVAESKLEYGATPILPEMPERAGYCFTWGETPLAMPASDLVFEGSYIADQVQLSFVVDGETVSMQAVACGSEILPPEMPEKTGYSFVWKEYPATVPAEGIVVEGSYTQTVFRLTFTVEGEEHLSLEMSCGDAIEMPPAPEKVGYTFSGWEGVPEVMPAEDLTFDAVYQLNSYRLTVIAGGETLEDRSVPYGEAIVLPEAAVREGYTFDGWGTVPETMPAYELTISSGYTPVAFRLCYVLDGEVISDAPTSYGAKLFAPELELPEGRSFDGWRDLPETMPAEDLTVYGESTANLYHLCYILNGEKLFEADVPFGEELPVPDVREEEGYTFSGFDIPASMPAEDLTLTAEIKANVYRLSIVLDGEILVEEEVACGEEIAVPEIPERVGATFGGWGEVPAVMPPHDLLISGAFIPELYHVAFLVDGRTVSEADLAVGAEIIAPAVPAKDPFVGRWSNLPASMPDHDITIDAVYDEDAIHTVTFLVDEQEYATFSGKYGDQIALPEAPTAPDKLFVAWSGLPDVMPYEDLTVEADFRPATYTVSFIIDGELFAEREVPTGAVVTAPDVPERPGYTFSGWQNFCDIMPGYAFSVTGCYTPNMHTVRYMVNGELLYKQSVATGAAVIPLDAPAIPDGTFSFWFGLPEIMPDEDITVEAEYNIDAYRVTYKIDGEIYYTTQVGVGRIVPKPNPPARAGYVFSGWRNYARVMPDYDFTICGTYEIAKRTVTYLVGGEKVAVKTYRVGEAIAPIDGSAFSDSEFESWLGLPAAMPDEDITVTAKYKTRFYKITYLLDEKPVTYQTVAEGAKIAAPRVPEKEGYEFDRWEGLPEIMPASDLIVTGVYEPLFHYITYRVDGKTYARELYPIGGRIVPLVGPAKNHYRFVSWRNYTNVMPDYDFTVDAVYEENICHYAFVVEGKTLISGTMRAGDPLLAPTPAEKPGYVFAGFDGYDGLMPATDVVYTGAYELKRYSLNLVLDGAIYRTLEYHEGDEVKIDTSVNPTVRDGYEFSGWSPAPALMPNHDVDIFASMTPLNFRLTLIAEGRTIASESVACDSPMPDIPAPVRHGYTFSGWDGLPPTMPPYDLTLYGKYLPSDPIYVTTEVLGEEHFKKYNKPVYLPEKKRKRIKKGQFSRMIIVSGDRLEMVVRGKCYEMDITPYVCDGVITDRIGFSKALAKFRRDAKPRKNRFHLIIDHKASVDRILDLDTLNREEVPTLIEEQIVDLDCRIADPTLLYTILAENEKEGTLQAAISVVDAAYFSEIAELLDANRIRTLAPITPHLSMLEYMQTRNVQKRRNAVVAVMTGGYIQLGLYLNGRIAFTVKNAIPYDAAGCDIEAELEREAELVADYLDGECIRGKITRIFYAGFRTGIEKKLSKLLRAAFHRSNKSERRGFIRRFTICKPKAYEIAYPYVKRRKKAKYYDANGAKCENPAAKAAKDERALPNAPEASTEKA
jgi:hypothetical protein